MWYNFLMWSHIFVYFNFYFTHLVVKHPVICECSQGRNRCNKAGLQIRAEDGVLDGNGNLAGHGTDPTGNVGDISALNKAVIWYILNSVW